jgi:type I restriction enzyme S subunit
LFSAHGLVLRPKSGAVLPEFLPFYMQSDLFMDRAIEISVGSLSPTINWKTLAAQKFALPPIDEQQRISKVLTAIDESYEACLALQASSAVLLQSLLDRMWSSFPRKKIGAIVEEGLLSSPQDGNHGEKHPKASDYVQEGVPFVMASDLKGGEVDFINCKKLPESLALKLRIGFARPGDVLLSHKGTVGQVARLGELTTDFVMLTPQVTYYRSTDHSQLVPDWLYFAFQTPGFRRLLEQYGRQSTRAYVGITTQRELSIPVADVEEQLRTLSELVAAEKASLAAESRAYGVAKMRRRFLATALA